MSTPLYSIIKDSGVLPLKSLGQNFLIDYNNIYRIANAADIKPGDLVYEVGPGLGGLTRAALELGAEVIAVEIDKRCLGTLQELAIEYPKFQVICGDAMKIDHSQFFAGRPFKIIANLPYNIGTPLLINWLTAKRWPPIWSSLTLMFQSEVADRLLASPNSPDYSRLTIITQFRSIVQKKFELSPNNFFPPPKVNSTVVTITPRLNAADCNIDILMKVTAAAFGQRRKMLRQSLRTLHPDVILWLTESGVVPTDRAEDLTIDDFIRLTNNYMISSLTKETSPV